MANERIYIVDWAKLATWLIPGILRQGKLLAFVQALVTPVNDLHTRLLAYRNYINYQLLITGQVCFLEKALNDRYDVDQRRIYITDGLSYPPLVLYTDAENKPLVLYTDAENNPLVLYTDAETAMFTTDFVVNVPATLLINLPEIRAFVNRYKLVSKTFSINEF